MFMDKRVPRTTYSTIGLIFVHHVPAACKNVFTKGKEFFWFFAIQEDETAIILFMLYEYARYTNDIDFIKSMYDDFICPAADFLSTFIDQPTGLPHASYDLWEEKFLTSTYTVSVVYGALLSSVELAKMINRNDDKQPKWLEAAATIRNGFSSLISPDLKSYRKGLLLHSDGSLGFDNTLDISSLFGMVMFAAEDETAQASKATYHELVTRLLDKSPSGGLPRYEHDRYFASDPPYYGNPWFVSTLWLAQIAKQMGEIDKAKELLDWSLNNTLSSGVMSEQIDPSTSQPKSVTPLDWSSSLLHC